MRALHKGPLDRVEYYNAVWRQRAGRRTVNSDVTTTAWLEPWPIPARAFRVDVYVYCDGDIVLNERVEIRRLGSNKHMLASPLGVVLQ